MLSGRLRNAFTPIAGALALALLVMPACVRAAGTAGVAAKCPNRGPARPALCASAYYILDETDFTVLAAHNERVAAPIASITKLMTSLVVLEAGLPMQEQIFIEREDVEGTAGTASRLAPGSRLSRADLLHLALMSSENRAAHALCRTYPGGLKECVRAMNHKAVVLGMTTAHFTDPTGLSTGNVSSAEDLAKLVRAAARSPTIREYSTDRFYTVRVNNKAMEYRSTNPLVNDLDWNVTVQKTGYVSDAGPCLVMQAVIDGRDVVIVLLHSSGPLNRVGDATTVRHWMESMIRAATR
jgi:serine-type D-Ala-D-Ala endopeptidase (penicillin-binding protein 7)